MDHLCALHPTNPLRLYCDSCKDAVCTLCTQLGPHADSRHVISSIEDAAELRHKFYISYRDSEINPLRNSVSNYLGQLCAQQQQYLLQRRVIEKDINLQFEGIFHRLNALITQEVISRQTEIKNYQEIINHCDDLVYSFDSVAQFPQRFLLCYKQFHQQLKQLQNLNYNQNTDVMQIVGENSENIQERSVEESIMSKTLQVGLTLPREMVQTLALAAQLPLYVDKNAFLNQLIGKTVEHYHQELKKTQNDIIANQKQILTLYNQQNADLLKMHTAYVCAYCSTPFSISESNQACTYNKSYKSEPTCKEMAIPNEIRGTKMHYWMHARKVDRPIPDINSHSLVRNLQKRQFMNSLKDIAQVRCKLRTYDIRIGTPQAYLNVFKQDDPKQTGRVTPLAFLFLMTNKFQVNEVQTQVLSDLCLQKSSGLVEYSRLEQILCNPLQLHAKFIREQQQFQKSKPIAPPSFKFRY